MLKIYEELIKINSLSMYREDKLKISEISVIHLALEYYVDLNVAYWWSVIIIAWRSVCLREKSWQAIELQCFTFKTLSFYSSQKLALDLDWFGHFNTYKYKCCI